LDEPYSKPFKCLTTSEIFILILFRKNTHKLPDIISETIVTPVYQKNKKQKQNKTNQASDQ